MKLASLFGSVALSLAPVLSLAACAGPEAGEPAFLVQAVVLEGPIELADGLCNVPGHCTVPSTRVAALRLDPRARLVGEPTKRVEEGDEAKFALAERVVDGVEEGIWISAEPGRGGGGRINLECDVSTRDSVGPESGRSEGLTSAGDSDAHAWKGKAGLLPSESVVVVLLMPATATERRVRIIALACETVGDGP